MLTRCTPHALCLWLPAVRPLRKCITALTCLVLTCAATAARSEAQLPPVGHIKLVHGDVTLINREGSARVAAVNHVIHEGDHILTGPSGELHAEMTDGALLAARPNAHIRVDTYRLTGTRSDNTWLQLFRGGMRFVTGWVARSNPPAFRLRTPVATIGIRGTDFDVFHLSEAELSEPDELGTHMLVHEGATLLSTDVGELEVAAGEAAFALATDALPEAHRSVPGFFQRKRGQFDRLADIHASDIQGIMMAKLTALSLARTGETLQQRLDRFRVENPDNTMSDREVMERVMRRAPRRGGPDGGGRSGRGGGGGKR